jgi:hypothetical protein
MDSGKLLLKSRKITLASRLNIPLTLYQIPISKDIIFPASLSKVKVTVILGSIKFVNLSTQ